MLTNRQIMQIKRSIGNKYGFTRDSVDITDIRKVPKNIVIDGGRIEIEVDFTHPSGFWETEIFRINPSDSRTCPFMVTSNEQ